MGRRMEATTIQPRQKRETPKSLDRFKNGNDSLQKRSSERRRIRPASLSSIDLNSARRLAAAKKNEHTGLLSHELFIHFATNRADRKSDQVNVNGSQGRLFVTWCRRPGRCGQSTKEYFFRNLCEGRGRSSVKRCRHPWEKCTACIVWLVSNDLMLVSRRQMCKSFTIARKSERIKNS